MRKKVLLRIITAARGNYIVVFADEFGQVAAYDTHGPLLATTLVKFDEGRTLRLDRLFANRLAGFRGPRKAR